MFFFTRVHFPRFFSEDSEKLIKEMLSSEIALQGEPYKYQALLTLKRHNANLISSVYQLKGVISKTTNLDALYLQLQQLIMAELAGAHFDRTPYKNLITNLRAAVEEDLREESCRKITSGIFLATNSLLLAISALALIGSVGALATGPVGWALLGIAVSAVLLAIAAYSVYVDGRTLFDKQLKEIDEAIQFLEVYPALVRGEILIATTEEGLPPEDLRLTTTETPTI
ncbi:hypothetical protein Lnau_0957 [Legionella nautarum]|uniref:Uncharacterized protein n=1 Tax=Legionella nautarum TaxID=45070 RepID=A0A0W0WUI3_9GAMM|nr:hypothetical protein [Legionella nautarum]KTD35973.1 hypothetical protein Lnau_0957 [Legionella nautarum]